MKEQHAKVPSMQSEFTEERVSHLLNKPIVSGGTVAFQSPDKFRREIKAGSASLTVCNGKTLWIYYPNFKEVEIYALGHQKFLDESVNALTAGLNFDRIDEFYQLKAFQEEGGYRLVLTPRRPNLKRVMQELTVWMTPDLLIQKTDLILAKGDRVVTTFKNARRIPIPAAQFEFVPPGDAHVSRPLGK
jgi:outer membrane lipoprotein-sorting protein